MTSLHEVNSRTDVKEYYYDDGRAEKYIEHRFRSPLFRLLHEKQVDCVNELLKNQQLKKVLELAPGPARLTTRIQNTEKGTLVDASSAMLNVAEKRLGELGRKEKWNFKQADIFELALAEEFDLVYTFRFLRHFDEEKRKQLYQRVREHLRPAGWLVFDAVNEDISKPMRLANPQNFPVYDELYQKDDLISELQREGFEVKNLIPVQCNFVLQQKINSLARFPFKWLATALIQCLEKPQTANPLEWIVVCQKK
jgi:ubiquinone/menaquinone biosynthesis C-methylase UbiE